MLIEPFHNVGATKSLVQTDILTNQTDDDTMSSKCINGYDILQTKLSGNWSLKTNPLYID